MARVKELDLGRAHQVNAYRFARRELIGRRGGIVLADGVGLGKTYEALATVATFLSSREHGKQRKKQQSFRILTIVPPRLVTKWADELLLPDRFSKYLEGWTSPATRAVANTFRSVVVLRRGRDLHNTTGKRRYGTNVLPPGFYLANANLLHKKGQKRTQIDRTPWDAVIVDEAHLIARGLLDRKSTPLTSPKAIIILLTATPFQLAPSELRELLQATNRRNGSNNSEDIYANPEFREYRRAVGRFFREGKPCDATEAASRRDIVSELLRSRMVRNTRKDGRSYHFVRLDGSTSTVGFDLFQKDDAALASCMKDSGLIELPERDAEFYMKVRNSLANLHAAGGRTFLAGALRQLLSTYQQFANSAAGAQLKLSLPPGTQHPKLCAAKELVVSLVRSELACARDNGWAAKILIFTTYVGAERSERVPNSDEAHGTAVMLKKTIDRELRSMGVLARPVKKDRRRISERLLKALERHGSHLTEQERGQLNRTLRVFAGTPLAYFLLASVKNLRSEVRQLGTSLELLAFTEDHSVSQITRGEINRRLRERRQRMYQGIVDRYRTRDLVARYDGATDPEERDAHLRGFNSPFQPLVLIASSVGQEGIDLQKYCRHVIHYDLEWNPARLEQREGRVDRDGRLTKGPVNVYFLLCRGTYDERVLYVMANRFRWHKVLLGNRAAMEKAPIAPTERGLPPAIMKKMVLDLRPPQPANR